MDNTHGRHPITAALYRILITLCMVIMLAGFSPRRAAGAAAIHLAKPNGTDLGTCLSWAEACTLKRAISVAAAGDEVWALKGTYYPTTGTDRTVTFQLKNGVAIYGGFDGAELNRNERDPAANPTILSGNIGLPLRDDDNSYHVVTASGTNRSAVLDGFTITKGYADGATHASGGGIINENGSPTLAQLIIDDNSANIGGGMYNYQGAPHLSQVTFTDNSATVQGGGMVNRQSSGASLSFVTFTGNSSASFGGGIYNENSSLTITDGSFTDNTANFGAGISSTNSNVALSRVTFSNNTANHNGGGVYNANGSNGSLTDVTFDGNHGSSLYNSQSSPTLLNVTFQNNSGVSGAGMYNDSGSDAILTYVTFANNTATAHGGGVRNSDSNPQFNNVIFINNSGSNGGGMDNYNSSPTLANVTFTQNSAAMSGGGINNFQESYPTLTNSTFSGNSSDGTGGAISVTSNSTVVVQNSILWGNSATMYDPEIHTGTGGSLAITYSDIQGGYTGTGNINKDPLLGSLGLYGGSIQVFPLLPGSGAINAGDNATCAATDPRGVARPQQTKCDMGAYESRGFTLTLATGNNQSANVNTPFTQALTVSISSSYSEPVNGGSIRFTAPTVGASAALSAGSATIAAGAAHVTATANWFGGSYLVTASAAGVAAPVVFHLTNVGPPGTLIFMPLVMK